MSLEKLKIILHNFKISFYLSLEYPPIFVERKLHIGLDQQLIINEWKFY